MDEMVHLVKWTKDDGWVTFCGALDWNRQTRSPDKCTCPKCLEINISDHELFNANGEKASLFDVCEWWIRTYPADVFVSEPKPVVDARLCMQAILAKRDRSVKP